MSEGDNKKKKVLVIEDDLSFSRMVQLLLKRQGYDVDTAFTVADGKKRLGDDGNAYDLIVLDLMMPEENGFDFLKWRDLANEKIKRIPILINTAKKVSDEEREFLLARSLGIVEKGLDFTNAIVKKVKEVLG